MINESKEKIIVILGPTASGKSDLAVRLAKKFNGEVVSADSRQVYRGLNIGTGKITKKEMKGVRHHLIDVADPRKQFTVERFKTLAENAVADILSRGKLPVICGGTGFYIDSLINGVEFPTVKTDLKLRAKLSQKDPVQLLAMLHKLDKRRWHVIKANPSDKKNARRLIRAIEVAEAMKKIKRTRLDGRLADTGLQVAGTARTVAQPPIQYCSNCEPIFLGIQPQKSELRHRIETRLLKRLNDGMIAEAVRLHKPHSNKNPNGGITWKRMEELGLEYRYLSRYLRGLISKQEMVEKLNTAIWQYARRQMTWWKRNKKIMWFSTVSLDKIANQVLESPGTIKQKG